MTPASMLLLMRDVIAPVVALHGERTCNEKLKALGIRVQGENPQHNILCGDWLQNQYPGYSSDAVCTMK